MYKKYRKELNLTQDNVAEIANIDIRTYQRIEAYDIVPLVSTFAKIALALQFSEEDIIQELNKYSRSNKKKGKNKIE